MSSSTPNGTTRFADEKLTSKSVHRLKADEAMLQENDSMLKSKDKDVAMEDVNKNNVGLLSVRAISFIILWYVASAFTLFLNKYILATMHGDPTLLSKYNVKYNGIIC